jgi:diguanylate cyclase (GGDEF)-like protein/PAS domain S-box-containing protein
VPALFTSSGPFGLSLISACGLLLLTGAAVASRPDRPRMAKLLARSDWVSLRRLAIVLAGFPLVIEINRLVFESLGASIQSSWALAVCLATVAAGFGIYQITADQNHAILDRLAMATELASTQDRYRLLAENSTDVIFLTRNGLVDWVSPSVTDVLGGRAEDWIGRVVTSAIHPDDLDLFVAARDSLDTTKPSVFRVRAITESGGHHWVEIHAKRFVGPDGDTDGAIASMSVVDDAVAAEVALDRLARTDVLTGLANRGQALSFLHDHLERPRRPGGDLGVLFYDVDHFKSVNDELGHGAGDLVLTTLSNRITSRTRQGDLVARLGGDEFIVLLVGIHGLDEAATIAEQIRVLATQPIEVDRGSVSSSLSIGVTVAVRGENADELIARADDAMYQAKDSGRNKVVLIPPG